MTKEIRETGGEEQFNKKRKFNENFTGLEKCLIFTTAIVFAFVLILLVLVFIPDLLKKPDDGSDQKNDRQVCESPGCVETSGFLLQSLKPTVNPCENFYEFACGTLQDKGNAEATRILENLRTVDHNIQDLLDDQNMPFKEEIFNLPKILYDKCLSECAKDINMTTYFSKYTDLLNIPHETMLISKTTAKIHDTGFNTDFLFSTYISYANSKTPDVFVGSARSSKYPTVDDAKWLALLDFLNNNSLPVSHLMGENFRNFTQVRNGIQKIINMDPELDPNNMNKVTILPLPKLRKDYPFISWTIYLSGVLKMNATEEHYVMTRNVKYLDDLNGVMKKTNHYELSKYFGFRILEESLEYLPYDLLQKVKKIIGVPTDENRQKKCRDQVLNNYALQPLLIYWYVEKNDLREDITAILKMGKKIKIALKRLIEEATWLDETAKQEAVQKLRMIQLYVTYYEDALNEVLLEYIYGDIKATDQNYLELSMAVQKAATLFIYEDGTDVSDLAVMFGIKTFEMKATFNFCIMSFAVLYMGIVNGGKIQYRSDVPNYLNYGGLGWVIGHEFMHTFDGYHKAYDHSGNLNDWLHTNGLEAYSAKQKCLIEQYDKFTHSTGVKLDGNRTVNENLVDIGGLEAAYAAYVSWSEQEDEPEPSLPGIDYTNKQLFWISAARMYCTALKDKKSAEDFVKNSTHSLPEFRVIGSFQNHKSFAEDFNCTNKDYMNPKKKCNFW